MFNDPRDLARAALELLDLAEGPEVTVEAIRALELGAATLCHHVRDWHGKAGWVPTAHEDFKAAFPTWGPLCQISNGTKHAKPQIADAGSTEIRPVLWKDADFWWSPHRRPILFVTVDGKRRSVSALIRQFVTSYIEIATPDAGESDERATTY